MIADAKSATNQAMKHGVGTVTDNQTPYDQGMVKPVMHVWTIRKPAWLPLPENGLVYETQDTPAVMLAALQSHLGEQIA